MKKFLFCVVVASFWSIGLVAGIQSKESKDYRKRNFGANPFVAAVTGKLSNLDKKPQTSVKKTGVQNKNYNKDLGCPKDKKNLKEFKQGGGW